MFFLVLNVFLFRLATKQNLLVAQQVSNNIVVLQRAKKYIIFFMDLFVVLKNALIFTYEKETF
jgi:hypothetical protein